MVLKVLLILRITRLISFQLNLLIQIGSLHVSLPLLLRSLIEFLFYVEKLVKVRDLSPLLIFFVLFWVKGRSWLLHLSLIGDSCHSWDLISKTSCPTSTVLWEVDWKGTGTSDSPHRVPTSVSITSNWTTSHKASCATIGLVHRGRLLNSINKLTVTTVIMEGRRFHATESMILHFNALGHWRLHHVLVLLWAVTDKVLTTKL